ncbi:hypothetical protein J3B01_003956 [Coemansia erecta]|nr:hypothetical protein J3B01_003956 [Coemansia erecta]
MERDSDVETVQADDEWLQTRRSSHSSFDEEELFSSSGSLSSLDEFSDAESDCSTPLVRSAARGDTVACRRLLQRGAAIGCVDSHGWTAVHEAARRGHHDTLALLLSPPDSGSTQPDNNTADADNNTELPDNNTDSERQTALPDINAVGPGRQTALHVAAQQGHASCVRLLLSHGARAAAADARRLTALDMCADAGIARLLTDQAKVQRLIGARDKAGQTKLHRACCAGDIATVHGLLAQGADFSIADNAGWTPLHEAALEGHALVVGALLRRGADFAARGFGGDTPLHDACANGHVDVVRRLLAAGADAQLPNAKGATPTDMAREAGHDDVLCAIGGVTNDDAEVSKADAGIAKVEAKPSTSKQKSSGPSKRSSEAAAEVNYHFSSSAPRLSRDERKLKELVGSIERMERHGARPRKRPRLVPAVEPSVPRAQPLLYTVQLRSGCFVVDLQVRMLLGMSEITPNPLFRAYPHLRRQKITNGQKERLWAPLTAVTSSKDNATLANRTMAGGVKDKQQFVNLPLYFVSFDEAVNIIRRDFPQIGKLVTSALDLGPAVKVSRPWTGPHPMMPLKYALKLHFADM